MARVVAASEKHFVVAVNQVRLITQTFRRLHSVDDERYLRPVISDRSVTRCLQLSINQSINQSIDQSEIISVAKMT